jgi:transcription elongation factor S-II
VYRTKTLDICANLDISNKRIGNKTLTPALLDGGLDAHFVAFMTPHQLHPARWSKEMDKRRIAEDASNNQRVTDIYKCSRCGDRKSTTAQMQTRSADEPMTIFVTCLTCYKTFTTQ